MNQPQSRFSLVVFRSVQEVLRFQPQNSIIILSDLAKSLTILKNDSLYSQYKSPDMQFQNYCFIPHNALLRGQILLDITNAIKDFQIIDYFNIQISKGFGAGLQLYNYKLSPKKRTRLKLPIKCSSLHNS